MCPPTTTATMDPGSKLRGVPLANRAAAFVTAKPTSPPPPTPTLPKKKHPTKPAALIAWCGSVGVGVFRAVVPMGAAEEQLLVWVTASSSFSSPSPSRSPFHYPPPPPFSCYTFPKHALLYPLPPSPQQPLLSPFLSPSA